MDLLSFQHRSGAVVIGSVCQDLWSTKTLTEIFVKSTSIKVLHETMVWVVLNITV